MRTLILIFILFPVLAPAQVWDDFSDGNFDSDPAWTGDSVQFEVNTSGQLHLKSSEADTSCLSTRDSLFGSTEWNFWLKISFNTSANNNVRVYLAADRPVSAASLNGFFLQVGGTNDSVFLVRQTGVQLRYLFRASGLFTGNSTNTIRFRVLLDSAGMWTLWADPTGGTNFFAEGSCQDGIPTGALWFGLYVRYTSSNATKVYFDDLYIGPERVDSIAPSLVSARFLSPETLLLKFSENLTVASAGDITNYRLGHTGSPVAATPDSSAPDRVVLQLGGPVPPEYRDTLFISGMTDLAGNVASGMSCAVTYYRAKAFDILIHEIMADPDPPGALPPSEYVELFNRSGFPVCMEGWTFEYGFSSKVFPDVVIPPLGYLIISRGTPFEGYGTGINLFTSSSSLSNEGTVLTLKNEHQSVIHTVNYSLDWFEGSFKEDGGWSLEMVDPGNPCGCQGNWLASEDPEGGTPGQGNSVNRANPDTVSPFAMRSWLSAERALDLLFSEQMDSTTLRAVSGWEIDPDIGFPDSILLIGPEFRQIRLCFPHQFSPDTLYSIRTGAEPRDCSGNYLDTTRFCFVGMPVLPGCRDLVINEILTNPVIGGKRFIELYNRSDRIFDMAQLAVSIIDSGMVQAEDLHEITTSPYLLFPGDYVVITDDPADIMTRYHTAPVTSFILMGSFPSLADDEGVVTVVRKSDLFVLDQVLYREEMQFPLLNSRDGVSLERVSPEGNSGDETNWHSASEQSGYATPGLENSQFRNENTATSEIRIDPAVFSPDNDGHDDVVAIVLSTEEPGWMVNGWIFDATGRKVRQLINSGLPGSELMLYWDGTNDHREIVRPGIYILYLELLDSSGRTERRKRTIVLSYPH